MILKEQSIYVIVPSNIAKEFPDLDNALQGFKTVSSNYGEKPSILVKLLNAKIIGIKKNPDGIRFDLDNGISFITSWVTMTIPKKINDEVKFDREIEQWRNEREELEFVVPELYQNNSMKFLKIFSLVLLIAIVSCFIALFFLVI